MPPEIERQLVARDLVRVSKDRSGREKSPDDQHLDHLRTADYQGWELRGPSYRDVGSASKFATRDRDGFNQLMADLESDKFGADILMLWENSRGSRKEWEWLRLIDLAELRHVVFWIDTLDRVLDPARPADRRDLIRAAADAAYESGLMSERVLRGVRRNAEMGLPHGRTTFGYYRRYDEHGRMIEQVEHPEHGPLVREVFARFDSGESLYAIAKDWNRRGVKGVKGGKIQPQTLRTILQNPAYIAQRVHDPGREQGSHRLSDLATRVPAAWPAIADPAVYWRIQRVLNDPARTTRPTGEDKRPSARARNARKPRPGSVRHLLTGLAVCDRCDAIVRIRNNHGGHGYGGVCGHQHLPQAELEELARDVALRYLAREDVYEVFAQHGEINSVELAAVTAELEAQRVELERFKVSADAGTLSAIEARAAAGVERRVAALEVRVQELRRPTALAGLIEPGADVAARWAAAGLETQRATLHVLFTEPFIGQMRLLALGATGRWARVPLRERVRFYRGEDDELAG